MNWKNCWKFQKRHILTTQTDDIMKDLIEFYMKQRQGQNDGFVTPTYRQRLGWERARGQEEEEKNESEEGQLNLMQLQFSSSQA